MNLSKMSDLELLQTYETFCYSLGFRHRIYEHEVKAKRELETEIRSRMNYAKFLRYEKPEEDKAFTYRRANEPGSKVDISI